VSMDVLKDMREVSELTRQRTGECHEACAKEFAALLEQTGMKPTDEVRMACTIMFNRGAQWALGVMKEEIER
jgi:hypothetical protein